MAFLTRDALDGGLEERTPMVPAREMAPFSTSTSPASAEVLSLSPADGHNPDDVRTPTSQVNMREKMLQQRQKMMAAKQRQMTAGASCMVTANSSTPVDTVPTPMGGNRSPQSLAGDSPLQKVSTSGYMNTPTQSFKDSITRSPLKADTFAEDEREAEKESVVIPEMTQEMKEEEARRRQSLSQELIDRGICPMFDPMEGAAPENKVCFDVSQVQANEFRSFLHNPMPKTGGMLQCRIVRDRSGITNKLQPKYTIESDSGVFLMCAQKQAHNKTPNYAISMAKGQIGKGTDAFLGKLRSDVCGLQWMAYGPGLNPSKADLKSKEAPAIQLVRDELVAVQYSASFWGSKPKGPRKMTMTIPRVQPNGERLVCRTLNPATEGLLALTAGQSQLVESFGNKSPKWNDTIGAYVLNFNKRVTEASVKNFQLTSSSDPDTVYLQFGKVGKDAFNVDFRHPISPFQAFAICLTAFDYKLGCE
jgi:hypothetical protein